MNETLIEQLYSAAIHSDLGLKTRQEVQQLIQGDSAWATSKVHDWRNHLPEVVADNWPDLPLEARLVAFISAARLAHAEEWD